MVIKILIFVIVGLSILSISLFVQLSKRKQRIEYLNRAIKDETSAKNSLDREIVDHEFKIKEQSDHLDFLRKNSEKQQELIKELQEKNKELTNENKKAVHLQRLFNSLYAITMPNDDSCDVEVSDYEKSISIVEQRCEILNRSYSNLKAIPYMSRLMADYSTYELVLLAKKLNWGHSVERAKKVESLLVLRNETKIALTKSYEARYQLDYLLELYPGLREIIETDYSEIPKVEVSELTDYDRTRDYLSKEEYQQLSETERNQLALDRYVHSTKKTKWQIGRDYELFVGYQYSLAGYTVDTFGSYMGLEDLGRDLICKIGDEVTIIQCKYWSEHKTIHEKHITQLYGTIVAYCVEHNIESKKVKGVLITNIELSETARQFASFLGIKYVEHYQMGDYPRIKCNIGHDEFGYQTKIYHLPFDQQYDNTKISGKGECYALTVAEAESKGFRRAHKWFGE